MRCLSQRREVSSRRDLYERPCFFRLALMGVMNVGRGALRLMVLGVDPRTVEEASAEDCDSE